MDCLELGNLDASRDWGFAGDYIEGMWKMLQCEKPGDYVVATGCSHSVREFCEAAASAIGLDLAWQGVGIDERAIDTKTGRTIVRINREFYQSSEPLPLVGNAAKAKRELGWQPTMDFSELARTMAEKDLERARR
jgi:GDPmannose 4,6-dehydratase